MKKNLLMINSSNGRAIKKLKLLGAFFLGAVALSGASAKELPYKVLHQFHTSVSNANGLIQASDGNFYGTTEDRGPVGAGTIYKVDASGNKTTLHSFNGKDGSFPYAALVEGTDGSFYGSANLGGAYGFGTLYKITASGAFTLLHSFDGLDGSWPGFNRWFQAKDGDFYGITTYGGAFGLGTVFKMTPAGIVTVLHSFEYTEGSNPTVGVVQARDGNFYGTTYLGGDFAQGTIYKMDASGAVTKLHSFSGGDGLNADSELIVGRDGDLYGVTAYGGDIFLGGVAYKITTSGAFTVLHNFTIADGSATRRSPLLQARDGNFYGVTSEGGDFGHGTTFKMTPTGSVTTLHSFSESDGFQPEASLIQTTDGTFYGTTHIGGPGDGDGTVFAMNAAGTVTTLYSFQGEDGYSPKGALVKGPDGAFYGTTYVGGSYGAYGTFFRLDPSGKVTTLHSFTEADGYLPNYCKLIFGDDGNLYGTTSNGGENGYGTVYKITLAGVLTTLHSFTGTDGQSPTEGVTKAKDGNFYGTTTLGGATGNGAIYKITPSGAYTLLYSFTGGSDGLNPIGTVIQGRDGNFYGTTLAGGVGFLGTVFKMDSSGVLTTLHSFAGDEGLLPYGGLVQGNDGNFYGTAQQGGKFANGTVYKITPLGTVTALHSFKGSDGALPLGELTLGSDGDFYGSTQFGGKRGFGTLFKITPAGGFSTLHNFLGNPGFDGAFPFGGPTQASDGSFYGTTELGGSRLIGVAYHLGAPKVARPE